jgi:Dyp-type peroxidase family
MNELEYDDIQGFVFSGYTRRMAAASYHLLRVIDAVKAKLWLGTLIERVTRSVPRDKLHATPTPPYHLNIAFSRSGLEALGLSPGNDIVTFERAFQEGMVSERRTRILGDDGPSSPDRWVWGNAQTPVDIFLALFTPTAEGMIERMTIEAEAYEKSGLSAVVPPIRATEPVPAPGRSRAFSQEHFGFADGISQPLIREHAGRDRATIHNVAAGEFILGYPNEYEQFTEVPSQSATGHSDQGVQANRSTNEPPFGRNGTYIVVRQLRQDVAAFWNFLHTQTSGDQGRAAHLAAKIVGRWPSGAVVKDGELKDPGRMDGNEFTFANNDPHGFGVPVGAHIRRANPRGTVLGDTADEALTVTRRHRLIRRGRSYGPRLRNPQEEDGLERGLFFIGVNANIERQFEFIQHSWMNNPLFGTLYEEVDPLVGDPSRTEGQRTDLSIPGHPIRARLQGIPQFVTVRAGGYFFLPGIHALRILAR